MNKLVKKFFTKLYVDNCTCIVCNTEMLPNKYAICSKCLDKVTWVRGKICEKCGTPMRNEATLCIECQNTKRYFAKVRSSLVYTGVLHKILLNFKFYNKRYLAKYLAVHIKDIMERYSIEGDLVLPVPISSERLKERGYNQVELMLDEMNWLTIPARKDILIKRKDNQRQSELGGSKRRKNVEDVYQVMDSDAVKGKRVIIIDDIITTGATINEIAKILLKAGAISVEGITVAITPYKVQSESIETSLDDYGELL